MAPDNKTNILAELSSQLSAAVEQIGGHIVAIHARRLDRLSADDAGRM